MRTSALGLAVAIPSFVLVAAAACGSSSDKRDGFEVEPDPSANKPPDPPLGSDGGGLPDSAPVGAWVIERVTDTEGTLTHDSVIAFTSDQTSWIAIAEPDSTALSDQDILVSKRELTASAWTTEARTQDVAVQNAFPSIAAKGPDLAIAYNGYPEGVNHIYLQRFAGGAWGAAANLTSGFDAGAPKRQNYRASLAALSTGDWAIAYISQPRDAGNGALGPAEVRVLVANAAGVPSSPPVTAVTPAEGDCWSVSMVRDSADKLHLVADCGKIGGEDLHYATNASGAFTDKTLPGVARSDDNPRIALDPDGSTLHLTWVVQKPCAVKNGSCGDIFYTTLKGGTQGVETNLSLTDDERELSPVVAADKTGLVMVAYRAGNSLGKGNLKLAYSHDGGKKFSSIEITEPDAMLDDRPDSIAIDPVTGAPHITFERLFSGTKPLNSDIFRASYPSGTLPK